MTKNGNFIIFSSLDPDEGNWAPVMPDKIPDELKGEEEMGNMASGDLAKVEGNPLWYRAERYNA